jgi:hypothetical protein
MIGIVSRDLGLGEVGGAFEARTLAEEFVRPGARSRAGAGVGRGAGGGRARRRATAVNFRREFPP